MSREPGDPPRATARLGAYAGIALLAALVSFGAVYVTRGPTDNAGSPSATAPAAPSDASTKPVAGLATGTMAPFVYSRTREELPAIAFQDQTGAEKTLADFRGKTILLNLWATWCAPCRKEMPSLDTLQKELGSDRFEVVALALDRTGAAAAKKFLDEAKVASLPLYIDPSTRAGPKLRVLGMPTTILIGPDGREIGRLAGPAHWDAPEAKRLIEAELTKAP